MRVHIGPGYRVYFVRTDATVYVLLTGGDKSRQKQDIARAKSMARAEGDEAMTTTYSPFDASAYLDNDEVVAEYLSAAAEDPNPDVFIAEDDQIIGALAANRADDALH